MSVVKTGGPAFPMQFLGINKGQLSYEDTDNQEGMSLRDWFAGQALKGILSNPNAKIDEQDAAKSAYIHADAMLAEREKSK